MVVAAWPFMYDVPGKSNRGVGRMSAGTVERPSASSGDTGNFDYGRTLHRCAGGDRSALRAIYDRDAGLMLGIVLAYTHGLTHGEIAARLQVPLGTAKSWIRRALHSLKECMQ